MNIKKQLYWHFIHHRYDRIMRTLYEQKYSFVEHVSSYLSSNGTSKTYVWGLLCEK